MTQQQPGNMHPQMMPGGGFPPGIDPAAMAMMQQQPGFNPAMMGFGAGGLEATMMAIQQFGQLAMQMGLVPGAMPMGAPGMMQGQPGMNQGGFQGDRGRRNGPGPGKFPPHNNQQSNGSSFSNGLQNGSTPKPPTNILSPTAVPFVPSAPQPSAVPTRPLSPTLCKFVTNCTNPTCRYSHPSPVATMESGIVLSTENCERGLDCDDKDCSKAHVSKAAKNPAAVALGMLAA